MAETLRVNIDHLWVYTPPPLSQHLEITKQDLAQLERGRLFRSCWLTFYHSLLPWLTALSSLFVSFSLQSPTLQAFIFVNAFSFSCVFSVSGWLLVYTCPYPLQRIYKSMCAATHGSGAVEMDGAMDGRRDGWVGGWTDREGGGCVCPLLWQ